MAFRRYVIYAVPGGGGLRSVETRVGGVLERLWVLSDDLEQTFHWSPAQATTYVLTGIPPVIETMASYVDRRNAVPALSRITITADPALSPHEVAEQYRQLRQAFIGARHRDLSGKHLALAAFLARRPKANLKWAELMAEWNGEHPDWVYTQPTNFGRDCAQATRRLLGRQSIEGSDDGDETRQQ